MDKIIVLKDGHISEVGSYAELLKTNGDFAEFLTCYHLGQYANNKQNGEFQYFFFLRQLCVVSTSTSNVDNVIFLKY